MSTLDVGAAAELAWLLWPMRDEAASTPAPLAVADPEEWLVRRAARGERSAREDLYRRHVDAVWRRLTRLVGPDPEREDLLQQIFLEVFQQLAQFRGDAAFATYLYRVQTNIAFDHLKRRGRRPLPLPAEMLEAFAAREASPEQQAVSRQRLAQIWAALDRMKPKKRIALVLQVVEGLSLEQIGELVEASADTVAKRIEHARKELQAALSRGAGQGDDR
jgi:RNA polymerase sigma-70 factor, ECF subfamily